MQSLFLITNLIPFVASLDPLTLALLDLLDLEKYLIEVPSEELELLGQRVQVPVPGQQVPVQTQQVPVRVKTPQGGEVA